MDKALTLQELVRRNKIPKRSLNTQKDGDLWEMFFEGLKQKGADSPKISKGKGHATDGMVMTGQVARKDKIGNDHADRIAEEGVKLHGNEAVETGAILTRRHEQYVKLIKNIHSHILAAFEKKKQLDKEKEEEHETQNKPAPMQKDTKKNIEYTDVVIPEYGNGAAKNKIGEMEGLEKYVGIVEKYPQAFQVQEFFERCCFEPVEEEGEGTSWVDFYTLYRMCRGEDGFSNTNNAALKGPSMEDHTRRFKRATKEIIDKTMKQDDAKHMKPNLNKKSRLRGLGIRTHMPMLNLRVNISKIAKKELAENIINSQRKRSQKELKEILGKKRKVISMKYNGKGRAAWADSIKPLKTAVFTDQEDTSTLKEWDMRRKETATAVPLTESQLEPRTQQLLKDDFVLYCGWCGEAANAHRKGFDDSDLGTKIMCYTCKKAEAQ